jgi:hypothetical protein
MPMLERARKLAESLNVWSALVGALVGVVVGVGGFYYLVARELPDLKKQMSDYHDQDAKRDERLQKDQETQFARVDSQLRGMRISIGTLCSQARMTLNEGAAARQKTEECVHQLLTANTEQADRFSRVTITTARGEPPKVSSKLVERILAETSALPTETPVLEKPKDIAAAISWSIGADNAKWSAKADKLTVTFKNGSAEFDVHPRMVPADIQAIADDFNRSSRSVRTMAFDYKAGQQFDYKHNPK